MERAEFAELKYFVSWFMEKTKRPNPAFPTNHRPQAIRRAAILGSEAAF
jgi:hypothetical protein